jgi:hypothetical protein
MDWTNTCKRHLQNVGDHDKVIQGDLGSQHRQPGGSGLCQTKTSQHKQKVECVPQSLVKTLQSRCWSLRHAIPQSCLKRSTLVTTPFPTTALFPTETPLPPHCCKFTPPLPHIPVLSHHDDAPHPHVTTVSTSPSQGLHARATDRGRSQVPISDLPECCECGAAGRFQCP